MRAGMQRQCHLLEVKVIYGRSGGVRLGCDLTAKSIWVDALMGVLYTVRISPWRLPSTPMMGESLITPFTQPIFASITAKEHGEQL
jgi:hypothetical protein